MRVLAALILSISTLAWTVGARADAGDGSFNVGVWRGAPVATDGSFTYCGMQAFFGQRDAPVALTIGLDRMRGWSVAIRSGQFALPAGHIKAGLAFDDEAPVDVQGEVESATTVSFNFPDTKLLDRHLQSRKLVLIFSDAALPFVLSGFDEATKALRGCVAANAGPATEQPATEETAGAAPTVAYLGAKAANPEPVNPRLFSEIVGPMIVGFVGSVLLVLLAGSVLFQIVRTRAKSRYLRLWSEEYRSTATRPVTVGLFDPLAQRAA